MMKINGTYEEEFKDEGHGELLAGWMTLVRKTADVFYESPVRAGEAEADVLPSRVSYPPSRLLIHWAVASAVSDLKRVKDYHKIGKIEPVKVAAYVGYWLARAKPFHPKIDEYAEFYRDSKRYPRYPAPISKLEVLQNGTFNFCLSVNEAFVKDFILGIVFYKGISDGMAKINGICSEARGKHQFGIIVPETIHESLLYYLRYRLRTAQELELFLKGLLACPIDCSRTNRSIVFKQPTTQ